MSDILRHFVPRPEVLIGGVTSLARLAHQAEDTDDDVLLMEVTDQIARLDREIPGSSEIYRQEYIRLHATRGK